MFKNYIDKTIKQSKTQLLVSIDLNLVLKERELKTLLKSFSVINPNFKDFKVFYWKILDFQSFQGHLVLFQDFQGPAATQPYVKNAKHSPHANS